MICGSEAVKTAWVGGRVGVRVRVSGGQRADDLRQRGGEDGLHSQRLEPHAMGGYRVQGSRVQGAGCGVQGAGYRVQGAGCRVRGAG